LRVSLKLLREHAGTQGPLGGVTFGTVASSTRLRADKAGTPQPVTCRPCPAAAMYDNDPLWKMRHALAGVALALLACVLVAAVLGRLLGDLLGGTYAWRVGVYSALLLYVVAGAIVLFAKVARHETRPVSVSRVVRWTLSLWLWPLLLALGGRKRSE
jgi:MFS family permease